VAPPITIAIRRSGHKSLADWGADEDFPNRSPDLQLCRLPWFLQSLRNGRRDCWLTRKVPELLSKFREGGVLRLENHVAGRRRNALGMIAAQGGGAFPVIGALRRMSLRRANLGRIGKNGSGFYCWSMMPA